MSEDTYNGWRNYATWRVMLEMGFGDQDWHDQYPDVKPSGYELADLLKTAALDYIDSMTDTEDTTVAGWAAAFVDSADFDEMADHILSDWDDQ